MLVGGALLEVQPHVDCRGENFVLLSARSGSEWDRVSVDKDC